MASHSSSTTTTLTKYDVFVSFCGADVGDTILSYLHAAFCRENIGVFIDDNLNREDEISGALLKTIEESKVSLVIFSTNYAYSRCLLDELVKIVECKNKYGQIVIPIFFKVNQAHVGKQLGTYAEALARHEGHPNIQQWRNALTDAASISGWNSQDKRPMSRLIDCVVQETLDILGFTFGFTFDEIKVLAGTQECLLSADTDSRTLQLKSPILASDGLVGIGSRISELESLLNGVDTKDVCVIGLWGMGGIGKSTLAATLINRLFSHFEGYCFLANVREECLKQPLENLQQELYIELLKDTDLEHAMMMFKCRFKRVLIVLDDVSNSLQIESLAGRSRFGPGSIIIITSRNEELLRKHADKIHEVQGLDHHEALCLLSQYAFKQARPRSSDDMRLANRVINFAKGNPLSLKILGSFLCGRSAEEQESAFSKVEALWKSNHEASL